jgi:hypothetical protein
VPESVQVDCRLPAPTDDADTVDNLLAGRAWPRGSEPFDLVTCFDEASSKLVGMELRTARPRMPGIAPIED